MVQCRTSIERIYRNEQVIDNIINCHTALWKKVGQFRKRILVLPPGTKTFVMPQLVYMRDQILGKNENTQFSGQTFTVLYGPPLPKYTYFSQLCPCSYKPQVKLQLASLFKN